MPKLSLLDYFTSRGQQRALESYGRFATGTAWSVPMKMDLYDLSREAFTVAGSLPAFQNIYDNLVSYWQVFRPHRAGECWDAASIFDNIRREMSGFGYTDGASLLTLVQDKRHS